MSGLPDYIPAKAPRQTVTDLSGSLSANQLGNLDSLGKSLSFKPRIIILPKSYKAQDGEALHGLAKNVASAWHVEGNRLLMIVDLSGKKVRIIAGSELTDKGVTNEYIQRTILPNYFYPAVRTGNIEGALNNSLRSVQQRENAYADGSINIAGGTNAGPTGPIYRAPVASNQSAGASSMISPSSSALPGDQHSWSGIACFAGILILATVGLYLIINKSNQDKSKRLAKALDDSLGKLYKTADDLGQASEYIAPKTNKEVALKVSAFFEKLQTLDKAKDEIEKFSATRRWGKANDGLLPALKLADQLNSDGEDLLEKVSAITGGVDTMKIDEKDKKAMAKNSTNSSDESSNNSAGDQESHKIKINMPAATPYQRPSWSYSPEYSQPLYINSGPSNGILDVLFLVNQIDNNQRLSNLENSQWSGSQSSLFNNSNNSDSNNYGNNNWSSSAGTDSGGSWSDSSSSGSDSGGSWDSSSDSSSSSDSGGSDSGGSW